MKAFFITFCMLMLLYGKTSAAQKKPVVTTVHYHLKMDTTKVIARAFNKAELKKYHDDPDFNFATIKTHLNWWDRFWGWVWHIWMNFWQWVADELKKLFGGIPDAGDSASVVRFIVILIAAVMAVYIIAKLFGINLLHLFKKKKVVDAIPYSESIENIHQISFDESIEGALAVKNYRLAVRLLYLRCLKQLSDKNLINWKIEKTNTAYLNELNDAEQRRQFALVTRQFEYVWYGDFPVDGESFQSINVIFQQFKNQLP